MAIEPVTLLSFVATLFGISQNNISSLINDRRFENKFKDVMREYGFDDIDHIWDEWKHSNFEIDFLHELIKDRCDVYSIITRLVDQRLVVPILNDLEIKVSNMQDRLNRMYDLIDRQFLSIGYKYLPNSLITNHNLKFLTSLDITNHYIKKPELYRALDAIRNNKNVLIVGKVGSGKTKLLAELLLNIKNDYNDFYFYVGKELNRSPSKQGVWIMDDIHDYHDKFKDHLRFLRSYGYSLILATVREEEFTDELVEYSKIADKEFVRIDVEKFTEEKFREFLDMLIKTYKIQIDGEPRYSSADFRPASIVFAFRKAKEEGKARIDASELDEYIRECFGMTKKYIEGLCEDDKVNNILSIIVVLSFAANTLNRVIVEHIARKRYSYSNADIVKTFCKLRVLGEIDEYILFPDYVLEYAPYWGEYIKPDFNAYIKDLEEYANLIMEFEEQRLASYYLNMIALKLLELGRTKEALNYHMKTLELDNDDKKLRARDLNNIGSAYYKLGKFDDAEIYYKAALKLFEEMKDEFYISAVCNNIGMLLTAKKKFKEAEEFLRRSLEIEEKLFLHKITEGKAAALGNLGILYFNKSIKESLYDRPLYDIIGINKACKLLEEALHIDEELRNDKRIAEDLVWLGFIYIVESKFKEALDCAERVINISKKLGYKIYHANALSVKGTVYLKNNKPDEALKCFNEALEIYKESQSFPEIPQLIYYISNAYIKKQKFKEAWQAFADGFRYLNNSDMNRNRELFNMVIRTIIENCKDSLEGIECILDVINEPDEKSFIEALSRIYNNEYNISEILENINDHELLEALNKLLAKFIKED